MLGSHGSTVVDPQEVEPNRRSLVTEDSSEEDFGSVALCLSLLYSDLWDKWFCSATQHHSDLLAPNGKSIQSWTVMVWQDVWVALCTHASFWPSKVGAKDKSCVFLHTLTYSDALLQGHVSAHSLCHTVPLKHVDGLSQLWNCDPKEILPLYIILSILRQFYISPNR